MAQQSAEDRPWSTSGSKFGASGFELLSLGLKGLRFGASVLRVQGLGFRAVGVLGAIPTLCRLFST